MGARVICSKCGRDITSGTNQADCTAMHMRRCTGKRDFLKKPLLDRKRTA
jgi:hypothetical protein